MREPIARVADIGRLRRGKPEGVLPVKPRLLFELVESRLGVPVPLNLSVPSSGLGSITMLEGALIVSLLRLSEATNILEFGTYLGYSTRVLAENSRRDAQVVSIDLGPGVHAGAEPGLSNAVLSDASTNDKYLTQMQSFHGTPYLRSLDFKEPKVRLIHEDSRRLVADDLGMGHSSAFVFVDGGHDHATVVSDTGLAMECANPAGVIVWHDYGSTLHPDVTTVVNGIAREHVVYFIQNTMLAFLPLGNLLVEPTKG